MPTVNVNRDELYSLLGRTFTTEEFEKLCFDFGLEFDGETTERKMAAKMAATSTTAANSNTNNSSSPPAEDSNMQDEVLLRVEAPANRYDLLGIEGLAMALRSFLNKTPFPQFHAAPKTANMPRIVMRKGVQEARPFIVSAVLRGITFTPKSFRSFIDLQDKLHATICKKRALVSIGTHDYDSVQGPFSYEVRRPEDIRFVPLRGTNGKEVNCKEMMEALESDLALREYLPLIRSMPKYPVLYDAKGHVMAVPPIINGSHSKMTMQTKNLMIDVTATDLTKAKIVLDVVACLFATRCNPACVIQQVEICDEAEPNKPIMVTPELVYREQTARVAELNRGLGLNLTAADFCALQTRMGVAAKPSADGTSITLSVPPLRSDILHECDVVEEVAIAYGFNNLKPTVTPTPTVGRQLPASKLQDLLAAEVAMAGYTEVMTFILCSKADNAETLHRKPTNQDISLLNSKTVEFQTARITLLTGLLRCVASNKATPLPIRIFEIGDCVVKDAKSTIGARNTRHLCAVFCGASTSGFEHLHGLLDRVMQVLGVPSLLTEKGKANPKKAYSLRSATDSAFLQGLSAQVLVGGEPFGLLGVVHPTVLSGLGIDNPCCALELTMEFPISV